MISNTAQTMQFYPFSSEYINANVTGTGVYMIRNILNQKCYVGSSTNLRGKQISAFGFKWKYKNSQL